MPSFFSQLLDFGEEFAGSNLGQVGASLIGTGIAQSAAEQAASTQAGAANRAADIATAIYNQQRQDIAPYRAVSEDALFNLSDAIGLGQPFQTTPGFEFRRGEGEKALTRMMNAQGRQFSGPTIKAQTRFADQLAQEEYNNYIQRLQGLSGIGPTIQANTGQLAASQGQRVGDALQNAAAARASGFVGGSNAITSGIENLLFGLRT
jgi:hypothetical protein